MKENFIKTLATVLGIVVAGVFIVGCQNNMTDVEKTLSFSVESIQEYDEDVVAFVKQAKPVFAAGIEESDIGLTVAGYEVYLMQSLSNKFARQVSFSEIFFSSDDVISVIQKEIDAFNLPDFENLTEEDISRIKQDFPEMTKEEIKNNIDMIFLVYQDQIGVLALKEIVKNTEDVSSGYARALRTNKIKDLFYDHKQQITKETVAAMVKHPLSAANLYKAVDKAVEFSGKYMGNMAVGDTKKDAFRHCIWNVALANEGVGGIRERKSWAEDFATAYEQGSLYTKKTSEMDLHNNTVGRDVYTSLTSFWHHKADYDKACNIVKSKADSAVFV
nr:hypothetical protein [Treponema sp.]